MCGIHRRRDNDGDIVHNFLSVNNKCWICVCSVKFLKFPYHTEGKSYAPADGVNELPCSPEQRSDQQGVSNEPRMSQLEFSFYRIYIQYPISLVFVGSSGGWWAITFGIIQVASLFSFLQRSQGNLLIFLLATNVFLAG